MSSHKPARPYLRRGSPLSIFNPSQGFSSDAPMLQRIDVGDSSDDELPQPMKFSALTKALLESGASPDRQENGAEEGSRRHGPNAESRMGDGDGAPLNTPSRAPLLKIVRKGSPAVESEQGRMSPHRVVQVSGSRSGSGRRTVSVSGAYHSRGREATPGHEFVTPAPSRAAKLDRERSEGHYSPVPGYNTSASRSASRQSPTHALDTTEQDQHTQDQFSASRGPDTFRHLPSALSKSRNTSGDPNPPGSLRVKRVPIGAGSFLRGAPVRRGFRRRESDDNVSPNEEAANALDSGNGHDQQRYDSVVASVESGSRANSFSNSNKEHVSRHDFAASHGYSREVAMPAKRETSLDRSRGHGSLASRAPSRQPSMEKLTRQSSVEPAGQKRERSSSQVHAQPVLAIPPRRPSNDHMGVRPNVEAQPLQQRRPSMSRPQSRPSSRIQTDAGSDQENIPPPTFRRNKDQDFKLLGRAEKVSLQGDEKPRLVAETPVPIPSHQSPRRALTAISGNTPVRRAPPPPPKMSVLDAATKTAGASTTKSKKRRQHILVNGKLFTQMNKIGKGGSSDVYCVMAENYKLFALKKVKLEDCDETAMRGFKGEIDLLEKLKDVERVVRLFDWELDNDKQILSVLMEKGDNDLNRTLTIQLNGHDPRFDPVLTRFYWKEMLECVKAVHEYDIVHSDLKPANFLSVQGKLKLIDFGIANAIDIDNTINVHRDSHIGTPNYMSPESITDTNAPMPGSERNGNGGRMMKLGKASDVWSLGCILYQMVYGRPPFAHIANQISRIMAITNPRVVIEYPSVGVGGVPVPAAVKNTLRKCLQRDANLRPTVRQLLSSNDPFLYPEAGNSVAMSEELLGQIIDKVVERCRDPKRGVPGQEEVRQYPASFMAKIREMIEREGVKG